MKLLPETKFIYKGIVSEVMFTGCLSSIKIVKINYFGFKNVWKVSSHTKLFITFYIL